MEVNAEVWCWTAVGMRKQAMRFGIFRQEFGEYVSKRDVEHLLEEADNRRRLQSQEIIDKLRSQLADEGYDPVA
jgi:hypothetical protein